MKNNIMPKRGDIWLVNFDPTEGDEIKKLRPAIVINRNLPINLELLIVVPITNWKKDFNRLSWLYRIDPNEKNNLDKSSAANCFQIRTVSHSRFKNRIGELTDEQIFEIVNAVGFCIGL